MKKRKLKGFVLPTIYIMVMAILFVGISFLSNLLQSTQNYDNLSVSAITKDVVPVVKTDTEVDKNIQKPFTSEKVSVSKSYYDMADEETRQEQSLVYYENTYLQNSGILYTADEVFEIQAVLDGTVTNVTEDEILGNVIELTHNTNLKTIYYSLGEINVKKDDSVVSGTVLGQSGKNNLTNEKENCLLFEVYYNGTTLDPEEFYQMKLEELQ